MSDTAASGPAGNAPREGQLSGPGGAAVPEGLVSAVVHLVHTGPVLLGAYTAAELAAVDAIVDFLETRPSADVLAEAVRSLAARQLLTAGSSGQQIQVRGDLGIAVAFQQRARVVLDCRSTGTLPGEPWRILLLPQPERICLMVRIDALGVHELGLYTLDEALHFVADWLPRGKETDPGTAVDPDALLASSERSALITVTRYTTQGSAEIAGASTDLILARQNGRLYVFSRAPADGATLVPRSLDGKNVRETLALMFGPLAGGLRLPTQPRLAGLPATRIVRLNDVRGDKGDETREVGAVRATALARAWEKTQWSMSTTTRS